MANRKVIYEACFEDYLRTAGVPYVAVDEAKKALFAGVRLKSFDFVVYSTRGPNLLVDVKGRRLGWRKPRPDARLENWASSDDLDSLARWEDVFGSGFAAALAFCYHLQCPEAAAVMDPVHLFRGEYYAIMAVYRSEYAAAARPRSRAWGTVSVPSATFREMAKPIAAML